MATITRKEVRNVKEYEVYSEKLGTTIKISENLSDDDVQVIMENSHSSLVGWCHGGWNNDSGGGNW